MVDGLQAADIEVAFGGTIALAGASFTAPTGRITGLIGPNGAGKTTAFNVCSGLIRPRAGEVRLFGEDVTRRSPDHRGRRGLGRTFQRVEICETMTVRENVVLGMEALDGGRNPFRQLTGSRRSRSAMRDVADQAMASCGILALADAPTRSLSTGRRRLVELARVLASDFRLLLLDEPSSGLDDRETEHFGSVLAEAVEQRHLGIFLVEHDMPLVMSLCERLYVLDFGQLIFEGTPAETQRSELVQAAYLGSATLEESGR